MQQGLETRLKAMTSITKDILVTKKLNLWQKLNFPSYSRPKRRKQAIKPFSNVF